MAERTKPNSPSRQRRQSRNQGVESLTIYSGILKYNGIVISQSLVQASSFDNALKLVKKNALLKGKVKARVNFLTNEKSEIDFIVLGKIKFVNGLAKVIEEKRIKIKEVKL